MLQTPCWVKAIKSGPIQLDKRRLYIIFALALPFRENLIRETKKQFHSKKEWVHSFCYVAMSLNNFVQGYQLTQSREFLQRIPEV